MNFPFQFHNFDDIAFCVQCTYINGSPQNTFVPGLQELARQKRTFLAGDDFKSGQTKLKSVLVDFLISAGIKPVSIVSYNHLGNNDGKNLSAPEQFRSKEISKSNVVDDMVESNPILYSPGEKPDHCVSVFSQLTLLLLLPMDHDGPYEPHEPIHISEVGEKSRDGPSYVDWLW